MQYKSVLLAVKDVDVSKRFYCGLMEQKVALDLGKNLVFAGGFCIQEGFASLTGIDADTVCQRPHNMELYFEVEDFDGFIKRLGDYKDVEYLHLPLRHEWQQRVVRIYDPDHHIIEIGESMTEIAKRYLKQGYSIAETAKIIQHPPEFVKKIATDKT